METVEQGKAALIAGIEQDARAEAEAICREAETLAKERRDSAGQQVVSILRDAEKKAVAQKAAIETTILSGIEIEIKRASMRVRDALFSEVLGAVEKQIGEMAKEPSWRNVLLNWTVEAIVGLATPAATISASAAELPLLDAAFCDETAARICRITGRQVAVSVSSGPPLLCPGIVATAADGRTAFDNQAHTRVLRKQREIRNTVHDTLFAGKTA